MRAICCNSIVKVEIDKPLNPEQLPGVLSLYDRSANVFGAELYRNGEAVDLEGCMVNGHFINAEGTMHNVSGNISGNVATVTLSAECYTIPGRFTLIIKTVQNQYARTIRIIHGYVPETMGRDLWKNIRELDIRQTGDTQVTITVVPYVNTGCYTVYEVTDIGKMPVGHIVNGVTITLAASKGGHEYCVQPMMGNEAGNISDVYGCYVGDIYTPFATLSVDNEGNGTITGAILTVDAEGNATLTGYSPSVDGDGDATIE